jgi:hypothetical protein
MSELLELILILNLLRVLVFVLRDYLINNKNIDYYTYLHYVEIGKTLFQVYQISFVNRTDFTNFDKKQIKDSD